MSKKTAPIGIVLLLIAIPLVFWLISPKPITPAPTTVPPPQISKFPTPTPFIQTVLSFSPNPLVIASPSGSLELTIDTGANNVTAVQVELVFDPKVLAVTDVATGTFFEDPITLLKNIDATNGKISYVLATSPIAQAKMGKGMVATITFKTTIASGQKTQISFSEKTLVTAEKVQESVLKSKEGATIFYVQEGSAQQTPIGPVKPITPSAN